MITSPTAELKPLFFSATKAFVDVKRQEAIDDVSKQLVRKDRFIALIGGRGSGKSYFIKRQLVPLFLGDLLDENGNEISPPEGQAGPDWQVINIRPFANPIGTLATALAQPGVLQKRSQLQPFFRPQLEDQLRSSNDGLIDIYHESVNGSQHPFNLLIIVDQLEELFRFKEVFLGDPQVVDATNDQYFQPGDDVLLFNLLLKAVQDESVNIYVVFSVSTENINRLNGYQGWPEMISLNRYAFPVVSVEELRRAFKEKPPPKFIPDTPANQINELTRKEVLQVHQLIYADYNRQLAKDSTDLMAKVNLSLTAIKQQAQRLGFRLLLKLSTLPDFLERPLAEYKEAVQQLEKAFKRELPSDNAPGKHPEFAEKFAEEKKRSIALLEMTSATAVLSLFGNGDPNSENRKQWDVYLSKLEEKQVEEFKSLLVDYFQQLRQSFDEFGGLNGIHNHTAETIYGQLTQREKVICERMSKALTGYNPAVGQVAVKHPVSFKDLFSICLRNGEDLPPGLLHLFKYVPPPELTEASKLKPTEQLYQVIDKINVGDQVDTLPRFIRIIHPSGISDKFARGAEEAIVDFTGNALIENWTRLESWVNEENIDANLYRKLVQDAILHEKNEPESTTNNQSSIPEQEDDPPNPWKKIWQSILDIFRRPIKSFIPSEEEKLSETEEAKKQKKKETRLSKGNTELMGDWLKRNLPSSTWAKRYLHLVQDSAQLVNGGTDEGGEETESNFYFNKAIQFLQKSKEARDEEELIQRRRENRKLEKARRDKLILIYCSIAGALLTIITLVAWHNARADRINLKLMDFVSSLSKTQVIPDDIFKSPEFRLLKETIEKDNTINDNEKVISFLAEQDILHFQERPRNARHYSLSKNALLSIDQLMQTFYRNNPGPITEATQELLQISKEATAFNDSIKTGPHYQFPYLYQALKEYRRVLSDKIGQRYVPSQVAGDTPCLLEPHLLDEVFYDGREIVADLATRPASPSDKSQITIAKNDGSIAVFAGNKLRSVSTIPNQSISAVGYFNDGRSLLAGTATGLLFRYDDMRSSVNAEAPSGLVPLSLAVPVYSIGQPIRRIEALNTPGALLVVTDTDVWLLQAASDGRFTRIDQVDLSEELSLISSFAMEPNGESAIVGGIEQSVFLGMNPRGGTSRSLSIISTFNHAGYTITAAAFDHSMGKDEAGISLALGTQNGEVWLSSLPALRQLDGGFIDTLEMSYTRELQTAEITDLTFNQNNNRQIISGSADGSVWLLNLDLIGKKTHIYGLDRHRSHYGNIWFDHLKLEASGRSIDHLQRLDANTIVVAENNEVRLIATDYNQLAQEVTLLLSCFEQLTPEQTDSPQ